MKVLQEPDELDVRAVRWTALGLLLGTLLCSAGAALILSVTAGTLVPAGFVAGRQTQPLRELAAIELGVFSTETGRGEHGTERPGTSPTAHPASPGSSLLPLEAALQAYVGGARPRRSQSAERDSDRVQPGALP